jgi:hypothetical protein
MEDLLYKIHERLVREADEVTYRGEKFRLGNMNSSGSRDLIGPNGIVGSYYPDTSQITVTGPGFGGEEGEEKKFKGPPRRSGWEISWEIPNPERLAGAGQTGIFFPKEEGVDYQACPMCNVIIQHGPLKGKKNRAGVVPGTRIGREEAKALGIEATPKGVPCSNCYGFGVLNPRVEAYANSLRKDGRAPKIRIARGISRYPIAGTEI